MFFIDLFGIDFSVALIIDMLYYVNLVAIFIKSVLHQFSFNVHNMNSCYVLYIKAEDSTWTLRQCNVQINMQLFLSWIDIYHDFTVLLVLQELVSCLREKYANDAEQHDRNWCTCHSRLAQTIWQIFVEVESFSQAYHAIIFALLLWYSLRFVHFTISVCLYVFKCT